MAAGRFWLGMGLLAAMGAAGPCGAQVKVDLYNEQGATAPCLGIGAGVLLVGKCVDAFAKAGFVKENELGVSGLTLSDADGGVTTVQPGSAAAQAGVVVGDVVESVDRHAAAPTAGELLAERGFGARGQQMHVTISRGGAQQDLAFARVAAGGPKAPKGEGFPTSERPLINWRGQFAPCIGMQPTAELAYSFCEKHFAPFGFVRLSDFSTMGFAVDAAAVVSSVDAGSGASVAGLKVGDKIVALEGQPLSGGVGANATMLLFGKAGQSHQVVVKRGGADVPVTITLGAKK